MPVNLELKLKVDSHLKYIYLLKKANAENKGVLKQKDIYYRWKKGLLKLRIEGDSATLIKYVRAEKGKRWSNFDLMRLTGENPEKYFDDLLTVEAVVEKIRTDFDLNTLSHAQKTLLTRYNNHVHQTTFWLYDENQNEVEEKSFHPLGDEYPGYRDQQTSRAIIPANRANIVVY